MILQLHINFEEEVSETKMKLLHNSEDWPVKPNGGLWTSTYRDGASEWVDACQDMFENAYSKNWFLLTPDPAARILVIDTLADLKRVLRRYPRPLSPPWHTNYINYEAIAAKYDGMMLTSAGQGRTRLSWPDNLYGWDSECTLWFRWKFLAVQLIPTPELPVTTEVEQ